MNYPAVRDRVAISVLRQNVMLNLFSASNKINIYETLKRVQKGDRIGIMTQSPSGGEYTRRD